MKGARSSSSRNGGALDLRELIACSAFIVIAAASLRAQVEFEVASVKKNKDSSLGGTTSLRPSLVRAQHVDAWSLVLIAFQLEPYQLIGMPGWTRTTYYDINAKPANRDAAQDQLFAMLQTLIRERFKLVVRHETNQVDGFALVRASPDKLDPNLRVPSVDCRPNCRSQIGPTFVKGEGVTMELVRRVVLNQVKAPISDDTALAGVFDVDLRWSDRLESTDDAAALFTALQEQLGLRLERRRVTTDVVVVEHIEHPGPD